MNWYCAKNEKGQLLHYVQGVCFWVSSTEKEQVLDGTRFMSKDSAEKFVEARGVKGVTGYVKVSLSMEDA